MALHDVERVRELRRDAAAGDADSYPSVHARVHVAQVIESLEARSIHGFMPRCVRLDDVAERLEPLTRQRPRP